MMGIERKLITILAADVQGYARLMEVDEEGTLAALKQSRDAMARLITAHRGRVVNTWGDGLLAEFASVVEAVRAAIDVQGELAARNAGRPSAKRMLYRIGINLGDVMVEGDDLYGDGVNIAARLQAEAPPGGIVISRTVYDQVRNKLAVGFDFLGELPVKSLMEPVPSYAVRIGEVSATGAAEPEARPHVRRTVPDSHRTSWPHALGMLAIAAAGLVAVNALTWHGDAWAQWPILAILAAAALRWATSTNRLDRGIAVLSVAALAVLGINLLSWNGDLWARWPLLGMALVAAFRWVTRGRSPAG